MQKEIKVDYVHVDLLHPALYNPRTWDETSLSALMESIQRFNLVDPIIANSAPERSHVVIGGHMRLAAAKKLGFSEVPVVFLNIPDLNKEKELNLRLNRNVGEFSMDLLAEFDESFLADVGFTSEELDDIFPTEENPEVFDLEKELEKIDINSIEIQKGDRFDLDGSMLMCGDSTIESDMLTLMGSEKANMVMTDPPYLLSYLKGKTKEKDGVTEGFGLKRNRRYLETDSLPDNFTELWMANVNKVQKENFHIICYENWKNIRTIWNEMEKYWKVKNMLVWHLPNRTQGFSAKYKFFSKHDIAMVGTTEETVNLNTDPEEGILEEEYETALFAISGKPQWEGYEAGKKICPTDFIEYKASDEKSSGQGIIFGTKPLEILIPYIKVLTKRNDLILEPFGGSGSTLIASTKLNRRCFIMEKSPVYAEVIKKRWENITGKKAIKINDR